MSSSYEGKSLVAVYQYKIVLTQSKFKNGYMFLVLYTQSLNQWLLFDPCSSFSHRCAQFLLSSPGKK